MGFLWTPSGRRDSDRSNREKRESSGSRYRSNKRKEWDRYSLESGSSGSRDSYSHYKGTTSQKRRDSEYSGREYDSPHRHRRTIQRKSKYARDRPYDYGYDDAVRDRAYDYDHDAASYEFERDSYSSSSLRSKQSRRGNKHYENYAQKHTARYNHNVSPRNYHTANTAAWHRDKQQLSNNDSKNNDSTKTGGKKKEGNSEGASTSRAIVKANNIVNNDDNQKIRERLGQWMNDGTVKGMAVKRTINETTVRTEVKVIGRENFLKVLQETKASLNDSMEKLESLESLFLNGDEGQKNVLKYNESSNSNRLSIKQEVTTPTKSIARPTEKTSSASATPKTIQSKEQTTSPTKKQRNKATNGVPAIVTTTKKPKKGRTSKRKSVTDKEDSITEMTEP